MLPNIEKLDSEKRMALIKGYVDTATDIVARGTKPSEEVRTDMAGIKNALEGDGVPYSRGEPLNPVSTDPHNEGFRMIGVIAAFQAQTGLPG